MGYAVSSFSSALSSTFSSTLSSTWGQGRAPWLAPLTGWVRRQTLARRANARPALAATLPQAVPAKPAPVPARPLRVLRVVDGASRQCAGRMVISGRMADVCAELDRLAAREAQRTH